MDGFGFCAAALLGLKGLSFQEYTLLPHFKKPPKFRTSPKFKICDFELHRTPHLKYAFRTSSTALSELAQHRLSLMRSQSFKTDSTVKKSRKGFFGHHASLSLLKKKARRGAFTAGSNFRPPFFTSLFTHQEKGDRGEAPSAKKGEKSPFSCPAPLTFWARCGIILPWVLWAFPPPASLRN